MRKKTFGLFGRWSLVGLPLFWGLAMGAPEVEAATINVPGDQTTIQAGINAAGNGDTVLVAPNTYYEPLVISGKTITLASWYHTTGNEQYITQTILDGTTPKGSLDQVILVDDNVGTDTQIIGFTIQYGDDGISCEGKIDILHNRFFYNVDAIDYESGGGLCAYNWFELNMDDGIDLDGACEGVFELNTIINNDDDGIEIRLHEYLGPTLNVVIRDNYISGNDEDGIQLIDYPDVSPRVYWIERNFILNSAMAGIGCMSNGDTSEDYRAADIPERVYISNNTIVGNEYGLTGGDNFIVLNNIFADTTFTALKETDGDSICSYNLLWNNGLNNDGSNIDGAHTFVADPLLDGDYLLTEPSPCRDAGTAYFEWPKEVVLDMLPSSYWGSAPDIGADEFEWDINGDGVWDAVDIQLVINKALDLPVPYNCDVNGDGDVNAVDIQLVINAVLRD